MTRILIAAALCLLATPALAQQPNCRTIDAAVAELADEYHERLVIRAISARGYMFMLFANPDGSTWTMLAMLRDGKTVCALDAGEGLQFVSPADQPPVVEGEGS